MKNICKILLFTVGLLSVSCARNEIEYDKGETPLSLTASTDRVSLDIRNPDADAIALTWTSGTNRGTNSAIEYRLALDRSSNNFSMAYVMPLGRNAFSTSFTNAGLNTLMMDVFGAQADQEVQMAARITADVIDDSVEDQISQIVLFNVKTYQPVTSTLFMIGDATPGGWSLDQASEMTPITGLAGGFTWSGSLSVGGYKFIPTIADSTPSYNRDPDSDGSAMLYRTADNGVEDLPFHVTTDGDYRVTANLIDLTVVAVEIENP